MRLFRTTLPGPDLAAPFAMPTLVAALRAERIGPASPYLEGIVWPAEGDQNSNHLLYVAFPECAGMLFCWRSPAGEDHVSCHQPAKLDHPVTSVLGDRFPRGSLLPLRRAWPVFAEFADDPLVPPRSVTWLPVADVALLDWLRRC